MDCDAAAPDGRLMPLLRRALTAAADIQIGRPEDPGMALRQGADRNHAWPRAPNNVDPHSGVRSRAIFSGQAREKRQHGLVIPAVSL